jgi:hypothetical protein
MTRGSIRGFRIREKHVKLLRLPFVLAVILAALLGTLVSPASAVERTCWGIKGDLNSEPILLVDWERNASECFGVAPSGTIWHTWEGVDAWYEMPGNGRASRVYDAYDVWQDPSGVHIGKAVKVVTSTGKYYCSYLDYATNTWSGSWYQVGYYYSSCAASPKYGSLATQWYLY